MDDNSLLLGFSLGAIMSLESTQASLQPTEAAQKVISLAGRFAEPVRRAPPNVRLHLIHGEQDGVVLPKWSIEAANQWRTLGSTVTLDLMPGLGHSIDARSLGLVVNYLAQG